MTKFLLAALMLVSTLALTMNDAEAKRMGGGGSFGRQSSNVSRQQAPVQPSVAPARPANSAASAAPGTQAPASPWKGMLGGALLGLGVGALLSHLGLSGAVAGMLGMLLMVGLGVALIMLLLRLFRKKSGQPAYQSVYAGNSSYGLNPGNTVPGTGSDPFLVGSSSVAEAGLGSASVPVSPAANWHIPADFDVPGFERNAKTYFIRLQAAWDKADINDIREFTTPEMYAEVRLQIQERGASANVTDVQTINAKLLGIETLEHDYLASVRFTGTIREAPEAATESFDEVWNLVKPISGQGGWLLGGIQQAA